MKKSFWVGLLFLLVLLFFTNIAFCEADSEDEETLTKYDNDDKNTNDRNSDSLNNILKFLSQYNSNDETEKSVKKKTWSRSGKIATISDTVYDGDSDDEINMNDKKRIKIITILNKTNLEFLEC